MSELKILHLDIEMYPNLVYTWALHKQFVALDQIVEPARMCCWAAKWHGEKEVFFEAEWDGGRDRHVKKLHKLIDQADAVCHYNGISFDMPRIKREFITRGMSPPSPYQDIDLLRTARQLGFMSKKLDWVSRELDLGQKLQHEGFTLWRDCMNGDKKARDKMEKYNVQDVNLTEKVYTELLPWIKVHPNRALHTEDLENVQCPKCGSDKIHSRGYQYNRTQVYRRFQCQSCAGWFRGKNSQRSADVR